jgi:hypothetical protein
MTHLYELKVCIKRASLENELAETSGYFVYGYLLTSDKLMESDFLKTALFFYLFLRDALIKT